MSSDVIYKSTKYKLLIYIKPYTIPFSLYLPLFQGKESLTACLTGYNVINTFMIEPEISAVIFLIRYVGFKFSNSLNHNIKRSF